jgi:hypothetical protein
LADRILNWLPRTPRTAACYRQPSTAKPAGQSNPLAFASASLPRQPSRPRSSSEERLPTPCHLRSQRSSRSPFTNVLIVGNQCDNQGATLPTVPNAVLSLRHRSIPSKYRETSLRIEGLPTFAQRPRLEGVGNHNRLETADFQTSRC